MKKRTDSNRLADMTAATFAQAAKHNPVVLLPLGSHEDHGPLLPMGDYLLAEAIAERIARAAAAQGTLTLVAPAIPLGVADFFGASPGSLALSAATFRSVLNDILDGLLRHGLTNILILNGHGGNCPVIHDITVNIKRQTGLVIPSFYLWKIARQFMEARLGAGQQSRFGHGAEPLLSLTKSIRPETVGTVNTASIREGYMLGLPVSGFGTVDFHGLPIDCPVEFSLVPDAAIFHAAHLASADIGAEIASDLVKAGAAFAVHLASMAKLPGLQGESPQSAAPKQPCGEPR